MTETPEYDAQLALFQNAYDAVAADLTAKGYQPVWCTRNEDGEWTPLTGTTGRYDFPAYRARPAELTRLALRPPPTVILLDVDHYAHKTGYQTIERAEEAISELPSTWRVTSRGTGNPSGRYLYRIPDSVNPVGYERALKFFGENALGGGKVSDVEIVRTGHRFSWAPLDINPKNNQVVQVYGPDGQQSQVPHVSDIPELPSDWLDWFKDAPVVEIPQGESFNTTGAEWWKNIPDDSIGQRSSLARLAMDLLYYMDRDAVIEELKRVSLALDPSHPWRACDFKGMTDSNTQGKVARVIAENKVVADFTIPDLELREAKVAQAQRAYEFQQRLTVGGDRVELAIEYGMSTDDERTREAVLAGIIRDEEGNVLANFDPPAFSDQELAEAVLDRIQGARYCTDARIWLVWKSETEPWEEEDDVLPWVITKLAQAMPFGDPSPKEKDDEELGDDRKREKLRFKNRQYLLSARGAGAVARKAASFLAVSGTHRVSYKRGWADADPDVLWAAGRCYDIRASVDEPVEADISLTDTPHLMTCDVRPQVMDIPGFHALVNAVLPDPVARDYWLDMMALGVTGHSSKRTIPLAVGATKSGKTILLNRMPFGNYLTQVSGMDLLGGGDREEARRLNVLVGRRLPYIDEGIPRGSYATARLKKISNGVGALPARGLYGKEYNYKPTHTLVMLVNPEEEPSYQDDAVMDRLCRVEFFAAGTSLLEASETQKAQHTAAVAQVASWYEPDKQAWKDETPGVLWFMLQRAGQILREESFRGTSFSKPESLKVAQEAIASQENPVLDWYTQCTFAQPDHDKWLKSSDLYNHYLKWGRERRDVYMSSIAFGRKLSKLGVQNRRSNGTHYAVGIQTAWANVG